MYFTFYWIEGQIFLLSKRDLSLPGVPLRRHANGIRTQWRFRRKWIILSIKLAKVDSFVR